MNLSEQQKLNNTLFQAISSGRLSAVKKAICLGAETESLTKDKQTPLFYAINHQASELIQNYLIERTQQLNFIHPNGISILQLAVHKNAPCLSRLLAHPTLNVNYQSTIGSALHIAIDENKPEIVQMLLNHPNIWINARNAEQETPLIQAIILKRPQIVSLLLQHKDINVHLAHPLMGSPAQIAFRSGEKDIFQMLKNKNATLKIPLLHYVEAIKQNIYA